MKLGEICYGLMVGFLSHIKPTFRGITIKVVDKKLFVRVYTENTPDEVDYEIVKTALSEAESQMSNINDYDIEILQSSEIKLQMLDFWFYLRYEGEYDDLFKKRSN